MPRTSESPEVQRLLELIKPLRRGEGLTPEKLAQIPAFLEIDVFGRLAAATGWSLEHCAYETLRYLVMQITHPTDRTYLKAAWNVQFSPSVAILRKRREAIGVKDGKAIDRERRAMVGIIYALGRPGLEQEVIRAVADRDASQVVATRDFAVISQEAHAWCFADSPFRGRVDLFARIKSNVQGLRHIVRDPDVVVPALEPVPSKWGIRGRLHNIPSIIFDPRLELEEEVRVDLGEDRLESRFVDGESVSPRWFGIRAKSVGPRLRVIVSFDYQPLAVFGCTFKAEGEFTFSHNGPPLDRRVQLEAPFSSTPRNSPDGRGIDGYALHYEWVEATPALGDLCCIGWVEPALGHDGAERPS